MTPTANTPHNTSAAAEEDFERLIPQYFTHGSEAMMHLSAPGAEALVELHFHRLRDFLLTAVTNEGEYESTRDVVEDLVLEVRSCKKSVVVLQLRMDSFMRELVHFERLDRSRGVVQSRITEYYRRENGNVEGEGNVTDCSQSYAEFLHERPLLGLPTLSMAVVSAAYSLAFVDRSKLPNIKIVVRMLAIPSSSNSTVLLHSTESFIPMVGMINIKTDYNGKFISLRGHVTKARPKRLRVVSSEFSCAKCGEQFRHGFVEGRYSSPSNCPTKKCRGRIFNILRSTAVYQDFQEIRLQEPQDETQADAGRAPRHIDVEMVGADLVDLCNAGDIVSISGVVASINTAHAAGRGGRRASETSTYKLYIKANALVNQTAESSKKRKMRFRHEQGERKSKSQKHTTDKSTLAFSPQQLSLISKLAHFDPMIGSDIERQSFPFDMLVRSLCPSIIGHDMVKAGLLLALLGGTPAAMSGLEGRRSNTIRSNSHVLIVGDPGMGKSQMLLAANQIAARSVYVGGNTSSTTGLTVSISKEAGGEVGIEAGALVLADQGICAIDEFDKMAKTQQDGLLEAMEQQQISVAKAGVVASLPSRCSVIAAANPKSGNYNRGKTVAENLNMASPLLSRFDLVFILQDNANNNQDRLVSRNIMNMYRQSAATNNGPDDYPSSSQDVDMQYNTCELERRLRKVSIEQKNPLPAELVKDYVAYAREYCKPKMTAKAAQILRNYFLEQRRSTCNQVPITTRQLEALIRLAQARAKACLREFVLPEDSIDVVDLMSTSVRQVHTDESGMLDKTRGGAGGRSKRKVKRIFLDKLRSYSKNIGKREMEMVNLREVATLADCPLADFEAMLDELRLSGDLIKTPRNTYKLVA